jgi:hypothetical protein
MSTPRGATDLPDTGTDPRLRILEPRKIAAYVKRHITTKHINAPYLEWFAAIILDPQQYFVQPEPFLIYLGRKCPVYGEHRIAPFLADAKIPKAHTLITIRHHPHPPLLLTDDSYERFTTFRLMVKAHGIPLRDHLSYHSTGEVFSWRDWDHASDQFNGAPGKGSGTSALISAGVFFLTLATITPPLMASMTAG